MTLSFKINLGFTKSIQQILTGFDSGLLTGMILIDLLKDFGTKNCDIHLRKIASLGFSGNNVVSIVFFR